MKINFKHPSERVQRPCTYPQTDLEITGDRGVEVFSGRSLLGLKSSDSGKILINPAYDKITAIAAKRIIAVRCDIYRQKSEFEEYYEDCWNRQF